MLEETVNVAGHLGELIGAVVATVIATLATLQGWLKIQSKRNGLNPHSTSPGGGIRKADLRAALLEQERELLKVLTENGNKIGKEGDETRRQMRDGFASLERAIREGGQ